jgi:hypothetical protein
LKYGAAHTEFIKTAKTVKFISWKHHLELVAHLRKWSRLLQTSTLKEWAAIEDALVKGKNTALPKPTLE